MMFGLAVLAEEFEEENIPKEAIVVKLEGVEGELRENIERFLTLWHYQQRKMDPVRIHRLYAKGESEILEAVKPFGYYQPTIKKSLTKGKSGWLARYHMDPGVAINVSEMFLLVKGDAQQDPDFAKVRRQVPLKVGSPLRHDSYEKTKRLLTDLGAAKGYFQGHLSQHEVQINLADYTAKVYLSYDSGPRYRFGQITFIQTEKKFDEAFLKRYLTFHTGDPFSTDALLKLQDVLSGGEYFSRVDIDPKPGEAVNLAVPILIKLTPKARYKYTVGFGYGTDTGLRVKSGIELRRLNQQGHHTNTDIYLSETSNKLAGYYYVPINTLYKDLWLLSGSWEDQDIENINSKKIHLGLNQSRSYDIWQRVLGISFEQEEFSIGRDQGISTLLIPEASLGYAHSDDPVAPLQGAKFKVGVKGALEGFLADTTFLQFSASTKWLHPVSSKGQITLRADWGTTMAKRFADLPSGVRFFAGGDGSLRGYDHNSVGPRDSTGKVIGGRYLLLGSAEYEHRIAPKWSLAFFYDTGNAMNHWESLKQSFGVGVRWHSSFGPLSISLASPLDESSTLPKLHVNLGTTF